jgi:hypothetical protein
MRLFQPSLQVRELPELKPILQRMWADGVAMGPLPARAGGPAARIPWQASLRHPDWVSPQVPLVDMVAAVFGFARDQSTLFNGNGFALRVGRPSTFGECDMATFRPIASSSGNTTTPKANDGDPTTRWISRRPGRQLMTCKARQTVLLGARLRVRQVCLKAGLA